MKKILKKFIFDIDKAWQKEILKKIEGQKTPQNIRKRARFYFFRFLLSHLDVNNCLQIIFSGFCKNFIKMGSWFASKKRGCTQYIIIVENPPTPLLLLALFPFLCSELIVFWKRRKSIKYKDHFMRQKLALTCISFLHKTYVFANYCCHIFLFFSVFEAKFEQRFFRQLCKRLNIRSFSLFSFVTKLRGFAFLMLPKIEKTSV